MEIANAEIPSTVVPDPAVLADAAVSAATDSPVPEQSEPRQPCCTDNGKATDAATDVNGTGTYTGDDAPDDASAGAMDAANDTCMVATTDDPGTEVDKYADKLLPKLGAFLTTQEAAYQFMAALARGISTVEMECCDKGLVLIAPNAAV
jgi:hypothetical protein